MGWRGFNCSIPHKVAIIPHLDGLGQSAATIGAVNCAVRRGDKFIGEKPTASASWNRCAPWLILAGKSIVVFGAGGAARAIAVEFALAGASRLTIVNRGEGRGRELTQLINQRTKPRPNSCAGTGPTCSEEADILVNATSIGLYPDIAGRLDTDLSQVRGEAIVADVIPNPPRTLFIREAEAKGLRTLDGLGMLVNQGVVSIRHWFGAMSRPPSCAQRSSRFLALDARVGS